MCVCARRKTAPKAVGFQWPRDKSPAVVLSRVKCDLFYLLYDAETEASTERARARQRQQHKIIITFSPLKMCDAI